jgi:hypothetical protein
VTSFRNGEKHFNRVRGKKVIGVMRFRAPAIALK